MTRSTDWEAIEREYRAGVLSIREIARQAGVTDTAIRKRARAEGWERDLTQKVRETARARLVREDGSQAGSQDRRANDAEVISSAAERQVEVVRQHRAAIGRGRDLTMRLLDELDATTTRAGELSQLIADAAKADSGMAKRRDAMLRAVGLGGRATVMRDLSTAAKNWIALERQAFSIDDGDPGESVTTTVRKIERVIVDPPNSDA